MREMKNAFAHAKYRVNETGHVCVKGLELKHKQRRMHYRKKLNVKEGA